jgi:hypothetical protein
MSFIEEWPYRWFGYWKEQGVRYSKCPSISDFIRPQAYLTPKERTDISRYLTVAPVYSVTSRRMFPCLVTGRVFSGSLATRTDGVWIWREDVAYYMNEHRLWLPGTFYRHIVARGFVVPDGGVSLTGIEKPPLTR